MDQDNKVQKLKKKRKGEMVSEAGKMEGEMEGRKEVGRMEVREGGKRVVQRRRQGEREVAKEV